MGKKTEQKVDQTRADELEYCYLNDSVKDFSFSEFVKLRSGPRGMLFSFGKGHPEVGKVVIFKEILLPFEVAASLSNIITSQLEQLKKLGLIEERPSKTNEVK